MSKAASARLERQLNELRLNIPENNRCADCTSSEAPRWGSCTLGVFLCTKCASIHRGMGSHISRVKSISLDTWQKDQVDVMKRIGNKRSNDVYNPNECPPPTDESEMKLYIFAKYRDKAFAAVTSRHDDGATDQTLPPLRLGNAMFSSETSSSKDRPNDAPTFRLTSAEEEKQVPPLPARSTLPPEVVNPIACQAAMSITRANTAPVPQLARTASPALSIDSSSGYNPFLRHLTASAQLTATSVPPVRTASATNPYASRMSASATQPNQNRTSHPVALLSKHQLSSAIQRQFPPASGNPSTVSAAQNAIMSDLAGLSMSSSTFPNNHATAQTYLPSSSPMSSNSSGGSYLSAQRPAFQPQSDFGKRLNGTLDHPGPNGNLGQLFDGHQPVVFFTRPAGPASRNPYHQGQSPLPMRSTSYSQGLETTLQG